MLGVREKHLTKWNGTQKFHDKITHHINIYINFSYEFQTRRILIRLSQPFFRFERKLRAMLWIHYCMTLLALFSLQTPIPSPSAQVLPLQLLLGFSLNENQASAYTTMLFHPKMTHALVHLLKFNAFQSLKPRESTKSTQMCLFQ